MKSNIKFGIGALLAAMLLLSMAFVPAVSAEVLIEDTVTEIVTTDQPELIPEPLPDIAVDTASVAEKNPYWYLLEADNEQQKTLFEYIDNSYVSKKEKQAMKKAMKDIWRRYPDKLTEEDDIMLEKVAVATAEYLNDKYGSGDVSILWTPNHVHEDLIYIACTKWSVGTYYAGIAKDASTEPDDWDDGFWQSLHHYYDPLTHTGLGAYNCGAYADIAKNKYDIPYFIDAYKNLGYSSHYMSDLGNPLHTGLEAQQYLTQWVHFDYETYVSSNWDNGYNFKSIVEDNNVYYAITDPEQSAKDLAENSNSYIYTLYAEIFYNPETWEEDPDVKVITENVLRTTAKYNLGLVKYVRS